MNSQYSRRREEKLSSKERTCYILESLEQVMKPRVQLRAEKEEDYFKTSRCKEQLKSNILYIYKQHSFIWKMPSK